MTELTSASQPVAGESQVSRSQPGLGFAVANASDHPVVYITDDPSSNTLTLTFTNQTGAAVTLKPGAPVPEEQITSQGPTSLYLSRGDLLTEGQLNALQISAPGWQAAYVVGSAVTAWALTPVNDILLPNEGTFTVTITHLTVSGPPRPSELTVDYFNVPGTYDDAVQRVLAVQTAPAQHHDLALNAAIIGSNVVYVSQDAANPIANTLVPSIANASANTPIVPGNVPFEKDPPVFFLAFAYGKKDGYGALTTVGLGQMIQVDPMDHTSDTWTAERVDQETGSYWRLKPQQHEVLSAGGRVGFTIGQIVTEFKPETLPTELYLQWANIPGYSDGYLSLDTFKSLPRPGILAFRSLGQAVIAAGEPVELTWQTFAVARVSLTYKVGEQAVTLDSATQQIRLNAPSFRPTPAPLLDTIYTLDAFDTHDQKVASSQVTISVTHTPIKIESLTVSPAMANFAAGAVDLTLTWSVTPAEMIKSLEIEGVATVTGLTTYVVRGVTAPSTYGLRAVDRSGNEHVASVRPRSLSEYLVRHAYHVISPTSWTEMTVTFYHWVVDRLEILSPTEARYSIDCKWVKAWSTDQPPPFSASASMEGYPQFFSGPWNLVGSTIHVVTSLGTLRFGYQPQSPKGEALNLENPPDPAAGCARIDFLLTPE